MKNITLKVFLVAVFFTLAAGGCTQNQTALNNASSPAPKTPPLPAATVDELASGKKVYESNCMICHKSDGTGGKVSVEGKTLNPDNLTSTKIKGFSDEKIIGYVMNGIEDEGMPAFRDKLSEGEMRDLVKYIRMELQHSNRPK